MLFRLKEIFKLRHQHVLTIISNSITILLVLFVNLVSSNINDLVNKEITNMGLDIKCLSSYIEDYSLDILATKVLKGNYLDHELLVVDENFFDIFNISYKCNSKGVMISKELLSVFNNPEIGDDIELNNIRYQLVDTISDNDNIFFDYSNCIIVLNDDNNFHDLEKLVFFKGDVYTDDLDYLLGKGNYQLIDNKDVVSSFITIFDLIIGIIKTLSIITWCVSIIFSINHQNQNILLREYEISLKKSLGASNLDIYKQFLLESVCITSVSLIISLILIAFINIFAKLKYYPSYYLLIGLMIVISILVGLISAYKSKKMNVLSSLRK